MGKYIKKKESKNSPGPKYRTPDFFKEKVFEKNPAKRSFNPSTFKVQHKG